MSARSLPQLLQAMDQWNSHDPHREHVDGVAQPRELVYAQRLTAWVRRLEPHPSDALLIAARGQHLGRWTIPRDQYARNRHGYLQWRDALKVYHAAAVGRLMRAAHYPDAMVHRVQQIIQKQQPQDPETQTMEDALCLVFFQHQCAALRAKVPEDTMQRVVRQTWQKMSPRARALVPQLPLSQDTHQWLTHLLR